MIPLFLTVDDVLGFHSEQLARWGGQDGVRDLGALESAVAQAQRAWEYQDADAFLIAATYAFHIAEAQAFLDGNKRTAVDAALTFLEFNGVALVDEPELTVHVLSGAMIALSVRSLDKAGLASLLRTLAVA